MGENDPRFQTEFAPANETLGGTTEPAGHVETELRTGDTGLEYGIGQSTSTGTLPTQGYANMDGTDTMLDTMDSADPRVKTSGQDVPLVERMDAADHERNDGLLMEDRDDRAIDKVNDDDAESFVERDGPRGIEEEDDAL